MKPLKHTDNETKLFEGAIADLRIAEKAGDIEEQEALHAEIRGIARNSDNPAIREAASTVINRQMSDMATYRSFLREIAELKRTGRGLVTVTGEDVLEHTISAFSEFGCDPSTHPTIRALVADAFAKSPRRARSKR